MNSRPDAVVVVQGTLAMSRLASDELSPEAADVARLVQRTLSGDSGAFEQIIIRYETRVLSLATRLLGARDDAQDAAQEVFIRAYKYLHRLDARRPLEPWLMRIAVNVCRDAARKRQRRHETFEAERVESVDRSADTHACLVRKQERALLQRALHELPEKERLALVLRDVEGLSTSEVAALLRSSETTVRSQVSRGRLRLKAAIDRLMGGAL